MLTLLRSKLERGRTGGSSPRQAMSMGQQAKSHVQVGLKIHIAYTLRVCVCTGNASYSVCTIFYMIQTNFSFQSMKAKLASILQEVKKMP